MEPTSHPRRAAYRYVEDHPGCAVADVARHLGVDHSTAAYHLHRLEREQRVVTRCGGRVRGHFVNGAGFCPYLAGVLPRLRTEAATRALEVLARGGATTVEELAGHHGVDPSAARWALEVLQRVGLAERVEHGTYRVPEERGVCADHAVTRDPCPRWGRCAVSREWRRRGWEEGGGWGERAA